MWWCPGLVDRRNVRVMVAAVLLAVSGVSAATGAILPDVVVSAEWLRGHQNDTAIVVLDARSAEDYAAGHLPGAVSLPAAATAASREQKEVVSSISQLRKLFSAAGVDNEHSVVIYDDGDFIKAARVFWVLEVAGHPHVAVLDGGIAAWRAASGATTVEPATPVARTFIPSVISARMANKFDTRLALENPSMIVIDARTADEYSGIDGKNAVLGHIPGAVNVPWRSNLAAENGATAQLADVAALTQRYEFGAGKKAVVYCNSGNVATVTYLAWRRMGWPVAMYDGSWWEWSADANLPIERGLPARAAGPTP